MDFLEHEVVIFAALDQCIIHGGGDALAVHSFAARIADIEAVWRQNAPIAFFQIGHVAGERCQCDCVGTKVHLTFAIAEHQRTAPPGSHHQAFFPFKDDSQRERAVQLSQCGFEGIDRICSVADLLVKQLRDHFGIGFRFKYATGGLKRVPQFAEILDDAIVDDGNPARHVRVGVAFVRLPVRCPACMRDACGGIHRVFAQQGFEIHDLSGRTPTVQSACGRHRDSGTVIAAIFQALQPIDQPIGNRLFS